MGFLLRSLGSNGKYQLGLQTDDDCDEWNDVMQFSQRPILGCGGNHTIVLSGESVYCCGDNSSGQCGAGNTDYIIGLRMMPLEITAKWEQVSCGWAYTLLSNDANEIWSCGAGSKGELGLGPGVTQTGHLRKVVRFDSKILKMASSLDHTVVGLENGDLYGWGNNKKQQLVPHDHLKSNKIIWEPTKLELRDVLDFTIGRESTISRIGDGSFSYLGKDKFGISEHLNSFENIEVLQMKSMWSSVHLLVKDSIQQKRIVSFGNNSHGQFYPQEAQVAIDNYAIGSEHGLITSQGKIYSWGWGEHGNCGRHSSGDSRHENVVFSHLNKIFESQSGEHITDVICGCATSWLILEKED